MSPRPTRRERSKRLEGNFNGRQKNSRELCLNADFHVTFRDLLHAVNLRHGTAGFTSPPKEGVLGIFSPWKIRWLRPGLNPGTWVLEANTHPLDHRSRFIEPYSSDPRVHQVAVIPENNLPLWNDGISFMLYSVLHPANLYRHQLYLRKSTAWFIKLPLNNSQVHWLPYSVTKRLHIIP
jgi:hypothetical protein